jgi:hypothetical protein
VLGGGGGGSQKLVPPTRPICQQLNFEEAAFFTVSAWVSVSPGITSIFSFTEFRFRNHR